MTKKQQKLFPMSRISSRKSRSKDEMDSVAISKKTDSNNRRAYNVLFLAQACWNNMEGFRRERERNKRYTFGSQWDDIIKVDGKYMTEEDYIKSQGRVPLKNNLISNLVQTVVGVYESQSKEPVCAARDRDEQKLGETMSKVLQYNMQLNRMKDKFSLTMKEFLISAFIVHKKWYGWKNGRLDCWTENVQPNNFFIDSNMRNVDGSDVSMLGEIHDVSFGALCKRFAHKPSDFRKLKEIYASASDEANVANFAYAAAERFGESSLQNYDFLLTTNPGRCRYIEVWRKEYKPFYHCHDWQTGERIRVSERDLKEVVLDVNKERREQGLAAGMPEDEIPYISYLSEEQAEDKGKEYEKYGEEGCGWSIDEYWYYYFLSPFGDILDEGTTPYEHESHPYVFKAYPFIDGEVHSFVANVIDQQRYVNRLITMYDWIMKASAKGVLLIPKDCLDGQDINEFAETWGEFDGVLAYTPSKTGVAPQQIVNKSVNIGITELLNIQLKFFDDISGVQQALQGKPGYSGESALHYNQQTENATKSLLDILESFSSFVIDGAYKDVKNMQQYYDDKKVINIAGKNSTIVYDPDKIKDVEFDLSITESTTTPVYRHLANDMLMQLWQAQAISVEQLLENGDFPFADELLQSIKSQKEQLAQGQVPEGTSPELLQQAQQGADMNAVNYAYNALKQPAAA